MAVSFSPGTSDPGYQQLSGLYQAQSVEDAKKRQQGDPAGADRLRRHPRLRRDLASTRTCWARDVTDLVRGMASQNTQAGLSQTARMQKEHADNQRRIQDLLASRGMLQSGETGYQIGEEALTHKQTQYGALRALLDYVSRANTRFAEWSVTASWACSTPSVTRRLAAAGDAAEHAAGRGRSRRSRRSRRRRSRRRTRQFYEQLFPPQASSRGGGGPSTDRAGAEDHGRGRQEGGPLPHAGRRRRCSRSTRPGGRLTRAGSSDGRLIRVSPSRS